MAKQVQLKQNGVEIYPRTITSAIADIERGKLLDALITEVETEALGWTIEPTSSASTLSFTLYKQVARQDGSGYDKVSASTFNVAQDVYLESVEFITSGGDNTKPYPQLKFVFNTDSGKETIYVPLDGLVDVYTAEGSGITITNGLIQLQLDSSANNILTRSASGLLVTISATGDTYVNASIDNTDKNKVVVNSNVATTFSAVTSSGYLADAKQAKDYVDTKVAQKNVSAESKSPSYITATASDNKVTVSAVTGTISYTAAAGSTPANLTGTSGIADASDVAAAVKDYTDAKVAEESSRLDSLQATKSGSTDYASVSVTTKGGNVSAVTVTTNVITNLSGATSSTNNLASAWAVKDYVDTKVGGSIIIDSNDIDATESATGTTLSIKYDSSVSSAGTTTVKTTTLYAWGVTAQNISDVTVTWPE